MFAFINDQLAADLKAVLEKHGINDIYWPSAFGQAIDQLKDQCLVNSIPWFISGACASYIRRYGVIDTLKQLITKLGDKTLNYNDLDCDMWARHIKVMNECLTCSSIVSKLDKDIPAPKPEDCPRCKGTKIDPEFHDDVWVLVYDNHGNGSVFIIEEDFGSYTLSIRDLPYNESREKRIQVLHEMLKEMPKGKFDTEHPLIRFRDMRDEGFVLSMRLDKHGVYPGRDEDYYDGEASLRAPHQLSLITEHFPCVLQEELSGKDPDEYSASIEEYEKKETL